MVMLSVVAAQTSLCKRQNTRGGIWMNDPQTQPMTIEILQTLLRRIQISHVVELEPHMVRARYSLLLPEIHLCMTDGHQIIQAPIENYLQNDIEWQKLLKAPGGPVRIPDVMKKYRTIRRIIGELDGRMLDHGNTIRKVSRIFSPKLVMTGYNTEPYMRSHGH